MVEGVLADDALVRMAQLANKPGKPGILNLSRASVHRLRESGDFPKEVRPMPGVVAWRAGDIRQWIASRTSK